MSSLIPESVEKDATVEAGEMTSRVDVVGGRPLWSEGEVEIRSRRERSSGDSAVDRRNLLTLFIKIGRRF